MTKMRKLSQQDIVEESIRAEIYSVERLEEYAEFLSENLNVSDIKKTGKPLLKRMRENGDQLFQAYQVLTGALSEKETISPAAEWLVDNFHIIEDQLREIRNDLPKSYYEELPKLSQGSLQDFPRVYALALALVAHTDSHLEVETIRRFIRAFQKKISLSMGELWAVPITLRLVLLENMRRVSLRVVWDRQLRKEADQLVDAIIENVHGPSRFQKLVNEIPRHCELPLEIQCSFVAQMAARLRDPEQEISAATERLDAAIRHRGFSTADIVDFEHQHQAANQITIANIIGSMRLISNIDWQVFFESVSIVDELLSQDPSSDYAKMDFASRDKYRHSIERIGKKTKTPEKEIALKVLQLAKEGAEKHVGYFLVARGVLTLEKLLKYQPTLREMLSRFFILHPTSTYLFSIITTTFIMLAPGVSYAKWAGASSWQIFIVMLLGLIPCAELGVSMVNFLLAHLIKPRPLPKIDLTAGVPTSARTLVVVPCMLYDHATIDELVERLEVHYLANPDPEIYFSLATDFTDAPQEIMSEDEDLVEYVTAQMASLNQRHAEKSTKRFFLFHRKRLWNPAENCWMGWERKRGKLHELNRLLRNDSTTSYTSVTAPAEILNTFKYVITLDADTQLPRESAKKLIGTALHPLNRPHFDNQLQRVVRGYGILQPRISISLESSARSAFAFIFSGHTGIDPYTTAVSNVYQDLFGEGSFTGKGLYDIDIFEASLRGRVPENTVLSHDLFEGLYARAALVTDIEFLDDYPKTYFSFFMRQHRWVRGDWQIAPWIFLKSPSPRGWEKNQLPLISRWKIYDNLRRSLVPLGIFLVFCIGWIFLPGDFWVWSFLALAVLVLPCFLHVTSSVLTGVSRASWSSSFINAMENGKIHLSQALLSLVFLPHQAYIHVDAIARVFYRTLISKKYLLEWTTAARTDDQNTKSTKAFWQGQWPVRIVLISVLVLIAFKGSWLLFFNALPFLLLWGFYQQVAIGTSRRLIRVPYLLNGEDVNQLRGYSRRIWHFFETFVDEKNHWLPPDNYQEDPEPKIAHRTSPTNIGLYLLSVISARDMGYLTSRAAVEVIEKVFLTIKGMAFHEGHLLNWYDTQTLEPLYPKYVSLVDSGNFAGYLLVVKQTAAHFLNEGELLDGSFKEGLRITLQIIEGEIKNLSKQKQTTISVSAHHLLSQLQECQKLVEMSSMNHLHEWFLSLKNLRGNLDDMRDSIAALEYDHGAHPYRRLKSWVDSVLEQVSQLQEDLDLYVPWSSGFLSPLHDIFRAQSDELHNQWTGLLRNLHGSLIFKKMPEAYEKAVVELQSLDANVQAKANLSTDNLKEFQQHLDDFKRSLTQSKNNIETLLEKVRRIRGLSEEVFQKMNFRFLLDKERNVFTIGYNVSEGRHDNAFYDLLASEARLASFVAIAKGEIAQKHWFRLGRQLVPVNRKRVLVSWSASMFEYLMPSLVMKSYENTLLTETLEAVVDRQIHYGKKLKVPWGVSEAGYNARDMNFNYQYGPFGIPSMGLKRGLAHDLVISPYSSFLAAIIDSERALKNLRVFEKQNLQTEYGFYESIDYTPERVGENQKFSVIKSFMAHHQGMSLIAIDNVLHRNIMQRRFHSEISVKATQLLLQESVPQRMPLAVPRAAEIEWAGAGESLQKTFSREFSEAESPTPRVQILSNGKYSLMITSAGSGYSKCGDIGTYRWREDGTCDGWGNFIFVSDINRAAKWSCTLQPFLRKPESYKVTFAEDKVDFRREDQGIFTECQVIVAPEENVEIRHVRLVNRSQDERILELTSYLEPVLAPLADDRSHPAFGNLFVQTEFVSAKQALLAKRRPRLAGRKETWGIHVLATDKDPETAIQYETDRFRFVGRGRSLNNPQALDRDQELSGSVGSTLEPSLSLRIRLRLAPGEMTRVAFTTGIAQTREEALLLADKYHEISSFERESKLAWTKSRIDLRHLGLDSDSAYLFQSLAERILYLDPALRLSPYQLAKNTREQASLWPYGIGGDNPIVAITVNDKRDISIVRKLLRGHEYLRLKGLVYDFVVLNNSKSTYLQELQEELQRQVRFSGSGNLLNQSGGIFVLRMDAMPEKDRHLIQAMARVAIFSDEGSLKDQIRRKGFSEKYPEAFIPSKEISVREPTRLKTSELVFFNGLGGFSADGREYVIKLETGQNTPCPWINVVANAHDFGFQVSEGGSGYTWSINSRENRLTNWSNDPVTDPSSEIFYLRDEETGEIWTPTPLPLRDDSTYVIRHGAGYSVFEHSSHEVDQTLTQFVAEKDSVKISHLRLKNRSHQKRKLTLTVYVEWTLGNLREKSLAYIETQYANDVSAIFAKNAYNQEFSNRVAFLATTADISSYTCDRREFLGRNGHVSRPEGLRRRSFGKKTGIGVDPCAVLQISIELAANEVRELVVFLGQATNEDEAKALINTHRSWSHVEKEYKASLATWTNLLQRIQVKTPEKSFDVMMNSWLLYQAIVCRIWARSAFYQSGGAYGFRDQLQDCMAFLYAAPEMAREHILRAAGRQFPEGDVQHWWHPPTGRGVRTHFSDDLLWLPLVVSRYIQVTSDYDILKEKISFIEAPLLEPHQEDSYTLPEVSKQSAELLDHCLRAIDRSLGLGAHGLPFMGCGDWNDGMNRVGIKGQGESVWMGWFLCKVLQEFLPHCADDLERVKKYQNHISLLKKNIEENAWDGEWYRRAFFDDGTPLGSAQSEECKIDSLSQSWSVLSGVGNPERQRHSMNKVSEHLIDKENNILKLLMPPFDRTSLDPGYIKGYVPGVRENGGQYTHAAIWVLMAFSELGDGDKALEIFNQLNPLHHSLNRAGLHKYKIEPYVVAADVYAMPPHVGRGGWSWYTGSASWFYRAGLESILGFDLEGEWLRFRPCIPQKWKSFEVQYLYGSTKYLFTIENPKSLQTGLCEIRANGLAVKGDRVKLQDDGKEHTIVFRLNSPPEKTISLDV